MKHKKHFQEVNDDFFETELYGTILNTFPELKDLIDEIDGQYYLVGVVRTHLVENILNLTKILEIISFINLCYLKGKHDTRELITQELFEEAYNYPQLIELFKSNLSKDAIKDFCP